MGNPIIYIVIGVLLIAIIAWFLISRKNTNAEPTRSKPVANPVPRHLQEETSETVPTSIPERDYIANAQQFIDQQRYQEAENELKAGLAKDTSNDSLMLKLLNVHALTSNRDAFNTLYNDFQIHASDSNLQRANDLKSMLDEENSLQAAAQAATETTHSSEAIDNTPLEFNLNDETEDTSNGNVSDDTLSFDDLESQLLDDTGSRTEEADAVPVENDEFDFSNEVNTDGLGSFDNVETSSGIQDDSNDDTFDNNAFDFSDSEEALDSTSDAVTSSQPTVNETSLNDDFDFSFDDVDSGKATPTKELSIDSLDTAVDDNVLSFDTDEVSTSDISLPTNDSEIDPSSTTDNGSLSFDDLDFDTEATSEPQQDIEDTGTELSDFEFGLDEEISSEPASTSTDSTINIDTTTAQAGNTDTTLEWDNSLPETDTEIKPALDNNITIAPDIDAVDDNEPVSDLDDTFAQLDAMSQTERLGVFPDMSVSDDSDNIDTSVTDSLSAVPTMGLVQDESVEQIKEVTSESITPSQPISSPEDSEFAEAFDFVQELDNSQITLDLANQYLELGEYESAKRLVDEVLQTEVTDTQRATAQDILDRMD